MHLDVDLPGSLFVFVFLYQSDTRWYLKCLCVGDWKLGARVGKLCCGGAER